MGRQLKREDLFLVRFWAEEANDGAKEWRGKVQRAVSGEEGYFHDWPELLSLLSEMLSATGGPGARDQESEVRIFHQNT